MRVKNASLGRTCVIFPCSLLHVAHKCKTRVTFFIYLLQLYLELHTEYTFKNDLIKFISNLQLVRMYLLLRLGRNMPTKERQTCGKPGCLQKP